MKIDNYISLAATNHYKMLVIVDNSRRENEIFEKVELDGWKPIDVTKAIVALQENIPPEKLKIRIGQAIKEWFIDLPENIILYNTTILYSPELGKLNPIGAFKYRSRSKPFIVIVEGHIYKNKLQYSQHGRPDFSEVDVSELVAVKYEEIND